ncbi:MAG: nucleotide exchange factor GrpE, partial [Rhodanobacter sp.]
MHNNDAQPHDEALDQGAQGEPATSELARWQARVAELETSNAELHEGILREKAEIENQRRRLHRDLEQAR